MPTKTTTDIPTKMESPEQDGNNGVKTSTVAISGDVNVAVLVEGASLEKNKCLVIDTDLLCCGNNLKEDNHHHCRTLDPGENSSKCETHKSKPELHGILAPHHDFYCDMVTIQHQTPLLEEKEEMQELRKRAFSLNGENLKKPERGKHVRFADILGLDLINVKVFESLADLESCSNNLLGIQQQQSEPQQQHAHRILLERQQGKIFVRDKWDRNFILEQPKRPKHSSFKNNMSEILHLLHF